MSMPDPSPFTSMQPVRTQYALLMASLNELSASDRHKALRKLIRTDLYYLLRYILNRKDMEHPWMLARIREVQEKPDGHLDLWGRDHRKSTIITFAKTLQDILASHGEDPLPIWNGREATFGIFSHTRPIAKAFLRQIKFELETNEELRELFPDVIWANPERDAPGWSEDNGLILKRQSNPKEATVEAWGVVDGQPTGKHFTRLIDDDIVTLASVGSPDMILKTTDAWALHLNLGETDSQLRVIGTRYHFNDSYRTMIERGAVIPRIRAATHDGTLTGKPVFLTAEQYAKKVREMGPYVASAQLLLNPKADSKHSFQRQWLRYYDNIDGWRSMNRALICDPANEKKRNSDYTSMGVVAKGPDRKYYLLDFLRDRLNLRERAQAYIDMHRKWQPQRSGYEKYGKDADIDYIREVQERENYRFDVMELGGTLSKIDRVNRLIPPFAEAEFYLPRALHRTMHDGRTVDLVNVLVEEEILAWPVPVHDDGLDMMSRIFDVELSWPRGAEQERERRDRYRSSAGGSWMSKI